MQQGSIKLKGLSLNGDELNNPVKRKCIFNTLKKEPVDIGLFTRNTPKKI